MRHAYRPNPLPCYADRFLKKHGMTMLQWFKGGQTNICYNALDRHVKAGLGDKIAFFWEGNDPGVDDKLTYTQLLERVCQVFTCATFEL